MRQTEFSKQNRPAEGKKYERRRDRQDVTDLLHIEMLFQIKSKPKIRAKNKKATAWDI